MLILTKKDHQDRTKNAKVVRFQNLPNFAQNFTQFLGYGVKIMGKITGVKIMGEKNKFLKQTKNFRNFFLRIYFYFRKYLWGSFSYFTVCTHINFTCTRSNSEGVI